MKRIRLHGSTGGFDLTLALTCVLYGASMGVQVSTGEYSKPLVVLMLIGMLVLIWQRWRIKQEIKARKAEGCHGWPHHTCHHSAEEVKALATEKGTGEDAA